MATYYYEEIKGSVKYRDVLQQPLIELIEPLVSIPFRAGMEESYFFYLSQLTLSRGSLFVLLLRPQQKLC